MQNLESPNKALRDQAEAKLALVPNLIDSLVTIVISGVSEGDQAMVDGQMRAVIYFKNQVMPKLIKERETSLKVVTAFNNLAVLSKPKRVSDQVAVIIGKILSKHASLEEISKFFE